MNKSKILCFCAIFLLTGCEYTDIERQEMKKQCLQEYHNMADNFLDTIAINCACKDWAARPDISRYKRKKQIQENINKCTNQPMTLSYTDRKVFINNCAKLFTSTSPSTAEQMAMGGIPMDAIAEIHLYTSIAGVNLYERKNNRGLMECACSRVSLQDNFILPKDVFELETRVKTELSECK